MPLTHHHLHIQNKRPLKFPFIRQETKLKKIPQSFRLIKPHGVISDHRTKKYRLIHLEEVEKMHDCLEQVS